MYDLAKQYLEGKLPTTFAVILLQLVLLIALWSKLDDFEKEMQTRLRIVEDKVLIIETKELNK